jgi:DNA mismatch endonuclease (patch repair protein)
VIFVHGCFWHQHDSAKCRLRSHPKTNIGYWAPKLARNRRRDKEVQAQLMIVGWKALLVWECEVTEADSLPIKLKNFLGPTRVT